VRQTHGAPLAQSIIFADGPARPADNAIICQWRVFASRTRTGDIKISRLISHHDCLGAAMPIRSTCNNQSWLTGQIPQYVVVSTIGKTTPCQLIDTIQLHHNEEVNYEAAYKAYSKLSKNTDEYERDRCRQIPAYLARVQAANPWSYLRLDCTPTADIDPSSGELLSQFRLVFICPAEAQLSFSNVGTVLLLMGLSAKLVIFKLYFLLLPLMQMVILFFLHGLLLKETIATLGLDFCIISSMRYQRS